MALRCGQRMAVVLDPESGTTDRSQYGRVSDGDRGLLRGRKGGEITELVDGRPSLGALGIGHWQLDD